MDFETWMQQTLPRTEIMRGGATIWPKGGDRLIGDTLGPIMHLHDDASEIYYFPEGRCRLEVGDSELITEPGDFVLVPPQAPHNFWNAGDEPVAVFWIVAPHIMDNKWRTEGFTEQDMQRRVQHVQVQAGAAELPSDANIHSRLLTFASPHETRTEKTGVKQEAVIYVKSGTARVQVGKLTGALAQNSFVHVPANTSYTIAWSGAPVEVFVFRMPAEPASGRMPGAPEAGSEAQP